MEGKHRKERLERALKNSSSNFKLLFLVCLSTTLAKVSRHSGSAALESAKTQSRLFDRNIPRRVLELKGQIQINPSVD